LRLKKFKAIIFLDDGLEFYSVWLGRHPFSAAYSYKIDSGEVGLVDRHGEEG
jgi:hypothetical protein